MLFRKVWFNMVLVKVGALKSATFMITLENENNLECHFLFRE